MIRLQHARNRNGNGFFFVVEGLFGSCATAGAGSDADAGAAGEGILPAMREEGVVPNGVWNCTMPSPSTVQIRINPLPADAKAGRLLSVSPSPSQRRW